MIVENTSNDERTSLDQAILKILDVLVEYKGMNVSQVAKVTSLNWKTADKALTLLLEISEKLHGMEIELYESGKSRMYILEDRFSLDKLPAPLRDAYIRSEFPEPSNEHRVLVNLLLAGGSSSKMAIEIDDTKTARLLTKKRRIKSRKDGKFYLTDIGMQIARGALKTYPELVDYQVQ